MTDKTKMRNQRKKGFTISEMLIAMLALAIATAAAAFGIRAASGIMQGNVNYSRAQTVCSVLVASVTDVLHHATNVNGSTFSNEEFGKDIQITSDSNGHLKAGERYLLNDAAYAGMKASIDYSGSNSRFNVKISVGDSSGTLTQAEFFVAPETVY